MSALKVEIWWSSKRMTSTGAIYPGLHWKGFSAVLKGDTNDDPVFVWNCEECAVFRWKRSDRSLEQCSCVCPTSIGCNNYGYRLDPRALKASDFQKFRRDMGDQLRVEEKYFRKHLLDVLRCYPQLKCDEFRLRISIDIKKDRIDVKSVRIEAWDREIRKNNPWGDQTNLWNERIKKRHPSYAGIGIVVVGFKVHYPSGQIRFEVQMGLPLHRLELPEKAWDSRKHLPFEVPMCEPDWDWAYDFADPLSDEQPTELKFRI